LILFYFCFLALPPSRFGEPPLPPLPLPLSSGDEELFSPGMNDMSPNCCGDVSPTFEKPSYREMEKTMEASRFVAQHVKNKDKFEQVSMRRRKITFSISIST
jgi:nicotinic acetylcholine receptor